MFILPLVVAITVLAMFAVFRFRQRSQWGPHPRCPRCRHLLTGYSGENCPECGINLVASGVRQPPGKLRWGRLLLLVIAGIAISIAAAVTLGPLATRVSVSLMGVAPRDYEMDIVEVVASTTLSPDFLIQVQSPGILSYRGGFSASGVPTQEDRLTFPNSYELRVVLMPNGDRSTLNQGQDATLLIIPEQDLPRSTSGTRWFFMQDPWEKEDTNPLKSVADNSDFSVPARADVPTAAEEWFARLIVDVYEVGSETPTADYSHPAPAIAKAMLQMVIDKATGKRNDLDLDELRSRFTGLIKESSAPHVPFTLMRARVAGDWLILAVAVLACGVVIILLGLPRYRHEPWRSTATAD